MLYTQDNTSSNKILTVLEDITDAQFMQYINNSEDEEEQGDKAVELSMQAPADTRVCVKILSELPTLMQCNAKSAPASAVLFLLWQKEATCTDQ